MFCRFAISAMLMLSAAPLNAANAQPNREALLALHAADLRVATIGYRLATRNVARCQRIMPATGIVLHSIHQYSPAARPGLLDLVALPSVVSILAVVQDSPAQQAGLIAGTGIDAINGQSLNTRLPPQAPSTQLRDAAETALADLPPRSTIQLSVRRGETVSMLALNPVPACRTRFEVVAGRGVLARSDGKVIQIGEAFAQRIDEHGLAVAVAHELAHTVLDHRTRLAALEAAPQTPRIRREHAALARRAEDEADLLSLHLLATAGWDPAIASQFMRAEGRKLTPLLPGRSPHRSAEQRARRMDQELARMARAQTACPPVAAAGSNAACH